MTQTLDQRSRSLIKSHSSRDGSRDHARALLCFAPVPFRSPLIFSSRSINQTAKCISLRIYTLGSIFYGDKLDFPGTRPWLDTWWLLAFSDDISRYGQGHWQTQAGICSKRDYTRAMTEIAAEAAVEEESSSLSGPLVLPRKSFREILSVVYFPDPLSWQDC